MKRNAQPLVAENQRRGNLQEIPGISMVISDLFNKENVHNIFLLIDANRILE